LALGLAIFGLFFLVLQFSGTVMNSGRLDPGLLGPEPAEQALSLVPVRLLGADFLLAAVAAAIAVPACYLAARRVAALTADEATRGVPGQAILYLRNFADDDIQMPTSRLSRNSLVERIAVYRTERFEEVLVRRLARFGPVTAVNPPGLEKPPIGAARMNMANADWQQGVQDHIAKAQLIVVGAAPEQTTKGLAWELAEIQKAGALAKTLLVLPPLPAGALHVRWALFRAMTPSYLLPPELDSGTDQRLILVTSGAGHWRTWHARRRTEWAYAVALGAAARALASVQKGSSSRNQTKHDTCLSAKADPARC
jgi:hypothetical protein